MAVGRARWYIRLCCNCCTRHQPSASRQCRCHGHDPRRGGGSGDGAGSGGRGRSAQRKCGGHWEDRGSGVFGAQRFAATVVGCVYSRKRWSWVWLGVGGDGGLVEEWRPRRRWRRERGGRGGLGEERWRPQRSLQRAFVTAGGPWRLPGPSGSQRNGGIL